MKGHCEDRREFLKRALIAASAMPLLASCGGDAVAQATNDTVLDSIKRNAIQNPNGEWNGAVSVPPDVSSMTVLSNESDKGEPVEISGTVYRPDGKTPAPNVLIYIYHTDFEGYYGRGNGIHKHGKYRGWMLTDKAGKYSFRTIKAAPYPVNRFAAHIHMTLTTAAIKEDWVDSILFEGDRLISVQERAGAGRKGGFNPIVSFEKGANGLLRATRDLQLMS
jgi:protocatechuate 3,4-dioxygenase, beta subunit